MITLHKKCKNLITFLLIAFPTYVANAEVITKGDVSMEYSPMDDGSIKVTNFRNKSNKDLTFNIDGSHVTVKTNSNAQPNRTARRFVKVDLSGSNVELWRAKEIIKPSPAQTPISNTEDEASSDFSAPQPATNVERRQKNAPEGHKPEIARPSNSASYIDRLEQDDFFGQEAVQAYLQKVNSLYDAFQSSHDKNQFIIDHDVISFLNESKQELDRKHEEIAQTAQQLIKASNISTSNQASAVSFLAETLTNRLNSRQDAYLKLKDAVDNKDLGTSSNQILTGDIINYCIIGGIILLVIILIAVAVKRKSKKKKVSASRQNVTSSQAALATPGDEQGIVVRRRTTSILKKQSIDDVIDNPMYLAIDTSEFSTDSAISKIYIKNSCIKDVYNLYAEDLRNTENPKEDGCMVLGRWIYDERLHKYDISLEEVVFPGEDAVFKEYELNFGGKIKLRIAERLRKLRRDTNLQYDLVCWIHSHPGLGVFFSNSDDNVQMQLKHPQHPNFLVAFVVDILTSDQEMGIFTFRKDGSMNSKADLNRMYSLEELYKWALQSERNSFNPENYYNLLDTAKLKMPSCKGVELNNNSIIDLSQITEEQETGIAGWAIGAPLENKGTKEFIVSGIVKNSSKPSAGIIGELIIVSNMSLPTIQRLIGQSVRDISFVMVYSIKQMTVTTIPVINGELLTDDQFYGDVTIDELKIWTRRKR